MPFAVFAAEGAGAVGMAVTADGPGPSGTVVVRAVDPADPGSVPGFMRDTTWLGIGTEEAPEALASQLKLEPGVGLVVTYVAKESPAAQAGLLKNDVLVTLGQHALSHPSQLRRLIQSRKEGEVVTLTYYRGGVEKSAKVTLAQSKGARLLGDLPWPQLEQGLKDARLGEVLRQHGQELRKSLENLKVDREEIHEQVRRSLEEAQKALREARHHVTVIRKDAPSAPENIETHVDSDIHVARDATVTVRSRGGSARSLVQTDDTGTCVLVSNPRLRLTAHDREGKLLFDGEIETAAQRSEVPADLWKKVEPLLKKLSDPPPR